MVRRAQTANWLAAILMVAAVGGVASLGEATDYYVSESLGNDSWTGLLPDPNPGLTVVEISPRLAIRPSFSVTSRT